MDDASKTNSSKETDESLDAALSAEEGTADGSIGESVDNKKTSKDPIYNTSSSSSERDLRIRGLCLLAFLAAVLFGGGFASGAKWKGNHDDKHVKRENSFYIDDDDYVFVKPFGEIVVPSFSDEILQGYDSREDLNTDLTLFFQDIANRMIEYSVMYNMPYVSQGDDFVHQGDDFVHFEEAPTVVPEDVAVAAQEAGVGVLAASATVHKTTLTNNQEKDVDEADVAKNDENYIYGAYGPYLVVLDRRNGTVVTKEKLLFSPEEVQTTNDDVYSSGQPMPSFSSLQLTQDHVIFAYTLQPQYYHSRTGLPASAPISTLAVYTKPTPEKPRLTLVASQNIEGTVLDSRYLEATDSVHITSFVEWSSRLSALDVNNMESFQNGELSRAEYVKEAKFKAEDIIADLVQEVGNIMLPEDDDARAVTATLRMWNWVQEASVYDSYSLSYVGAVVVTAIRAQDLPTTATNPSAVIPTSTASLIAPNTPGVYATDDSMVIYFSIYGVEEIVFLTHLKVDPTAASMSFHSVGRTGGHLSNKYGIDIQGDDLRLATVQNVAPAVDMWASAATICSQNWDMSESCPGGLTAYDVCVNLVMVGCQVVEGSGCPVCADDENTEVSLDISSTANHIVVMDIGKGGEMKEIGRVRIGEVNEVIFGARFGETFVYANTFDQADPFYAIDLQPGQPPVVLGSVKLTGFFNFIEPLNEDGTLLVAIGQNVTTVDGMMMPVGVMLSVFNVSNPSQPEVVDTVLLAQQEGREVGSNALYDPKSIQHHEGLLAIPLNSYSTNYNTQGNTDFDGFIVIDVGNAAEQGIKELFKVNHMCTGGNCYYSCNGGLMSYRAFFFDASVVTMSTQLVVSSDSVSGDTLWSTVVETDGDSMHGCW